MRHHSVSAVYSSTVLPDSNDTAFPTCSADDEHEIIGVQIEALKLKQPNLG